MIQFRLRQGVLGEFHPGMCFEFLVRLFDADMKHRVEAASPDGGIHGQCLWQAGGLDQAATSSNLRETRKLVSRDHIHPRWSTLAGVFGPAFHHLAGTRVPAEPQGCLDDRQRAEKHDQPGALPQVKLLEALQGAREGYAGLGWV
jgi:hypothetical protein